MIVLSGYTCRAWLVSPLRKLSKLGRPKKALLSTPQSVHGCGSTNCLWNRLAGQIMVHFQAPLSGPHFCCLQGASHRMLVSTPPPLGRLMIESQYVVLGRDRYAVAWLTRRRRCRIIVRSVQWRTMGTGKNGLGYWGHGLWRSGSPLMSCWMKFRT